jgi:hypothetical protein
MTHPVASPPRPAGYAFPLAELETARLMAARLGWQLVILLDHGGPGEDYEEVLALTPRRGGRWLLWRGAEQLRLLSPDGRMLAFTELRAALAAIGGRGG